MSHEGKPLEALQRSHVKDVTEKTTLVYTVLLSGW